MILQMPRESLKVDSVITLSRLSIMLDGKIQYCCISDINKQISSTLSCLSDSVLSDSVITYVKLVMQPKN